MKNLHSIVLTLLAIMLFTGCDKLEDIFGGENSNNPQIEIHTSEVLFTTDGGNNTISFTTNEAWTAQVINSRADNWCEIYPTSGSAGDATISVITTPNDTPDDRTASIVIKAGTVSKTVTVSQKQKDVLTVTSSKFEVEATGGEVKIEVSHNIDFDIEIANDWITKVDTRAFATKTIVFNIAKHTGHDNREGTIIFKSKDGKLTQTVKVYQAQEDALIISKKDIVVSDEGGTISFELHTNVDFKVSDPDVDWLRPVATRGLTSHTLNYTVDANTSYNSREAHIVVTDTKNNKSETITITQAQKDAIIITKTQYDVMSKGEQIQIEVNSNVDFIIEISDAWIQHITTRSLQTEFLIFEIQQNTNKNDRRGFVKFVSQDETISQTVNINQSCANGNIEDIENGDTNEW